MTRVLQGAARGWGNGGPERVGKFHLLYSRAVPPGLSS